MKLLVLSILLVASTSAFAAGSETEPTFMLPAGSTVKWLAPPLCDTKGLSPQRFRLDHKVEAWALQGKRTLSNLDTGFTFSVARDIVDFIWMDDGSLLLVSESALGVLAPAREAGSPVMFQPVIKLPAPGMRLATDGRDALFAYGFNPELKAHAVFRLKDGFAGWQMLLVTAEPISGACFDGTLLSVAAGRTVHQVRPGERKSIAGFTHPNETITGLTCSPEAGLFYVTAKGVGKVKGGLLQFASAEGAQIEARGSSLYLFFPKSLGAMQLDGANLVFSER